VAEEFLKNVRSHTQEAPTENVFFVLVCDFQLQPITIEVMNI